MRLLGSELKMARELPRGWGLAVAMLLMLPLTIFLGCGDDSPTTPAQTVSPTASFSRTPLSGPAPLAVQFTDTSEPGSAPITAWLWNFGDGGTSTLQNPGHTYTADGTYEVSLRVTTSVGSNTKTTPANVIVTTQTVSPTASFARTPLSGPPPLLVEFTDTSEPGSAPITAWLWDFGDGGTSTLESPSHTYIADGSYEVSLRVTTSVGSDTRSMPASVVVETALPTRIIDTVNTTPNTPGLPEPLQFGDILPSFSAGIVVQEARVRQFYPIVNRAYLTQWAGNRGENDCQPMPALSEPAAPTRGWSTSIPARNSWTNRKWFGGYNDPWPAPFPTRLLLIGQFDSPGHEQHGNSFVLGGFARWQSCETRTPFLREPFTSYVLSYNAQVADWPRMRHYRLWKKLGEISAPDGTQITQTFSWTKGVTTTEASEFTASVSVTGGVKGPTAHAELTATVSLTLSQSITFSADELRSVAFTADRTQRPEYKLQYSVWALVDRYVIEGSVPGTPWSDPNYELSSSNAASFRLDHVSDTTFAIQSAWFLR